jgi:hypothetical protein
MARAAVIRLKPPDHISAQSLISTQYGNHVQCMLTPYLTLASVVSLFSFFFPLTHLFICLQVCHGTCASKIQACLLRFP